jgi:hypothetical protein
MFNFRMVCIYIVTLTILKLLWLLLIINNTSLNSRLYEIKLFGKNRTIFYLNLVCIHKCFSLLWHSYFHPEKKTDNISVFIICSLYDGITSVTIFIVIIHRKSQHPVGIKSLAYLMNYPV